MLTIRLKSPMNLMLLYILLLTCGTLTFALTTPLSAEELDFEKEFAVQQKSTLDTFPLQEIDTDSLSDLAIEGALQVQNNTPTDGKPVHLKVKEENDKKKSGNVLSETDKDLTKEDEIRKFSQIAPNDPQFQPIIYSEPTGRTYTEHHTTTTFRP
jgi:hypothetical protein